MLDAKQKSGWQCITLLSTLLFLFGTPLAERALEVTLQIPSFLCHTRVGINLFYLKTMSKGLLFSYFSHSSWKQILYHSKEEDNWYTTDCFVLYILLLMRFAFLCVSEPILESWNSIVKDARGLKRLRVSSSTAVSGFIHKYNIHKCNSDPGT